MLWLEKIIKPHRGTRNNNDPSFSHLFMPRHSWRGADAQQPELRESEQPVDSEVLLVWRHEGELA